MRARRKRGFSILQLWTILSCLSAALLLGIDGSTADSTAPAAAGLGPDPPLPDPAHALIPTIRVAPAVGWAGEEAPTPAPGFVVNAFAANLDHPRWLQALPIGDVLVAESNAPPRPDNGRGFKAWWVARYMRRAGAAVSSADRITLLRDTDHDGVADLRTVFLTGLHSPFGMSLVGDSLFVADTDAILRFHYRPGDTRIEGAGEKLVDLPAGPINHHWTKNVVASASGELLYVTVGSNSNVGENGIANEAGRAMVLEINATTGRSRVFASGLRNPNGLGWQPDSGALWVVVNERDELGDDLVPDYMTALTGGAFYGWPYSYFGQHVDARVAPQRPDLVATARVPDYALGAHTASLGLAFGQGGLFPARYAGGAFIGQHGSWNRKPASGYKVIFVPFAGGQPAGAPEDVLTGFLNPRGEARGRPVGVAFDGQGALLVADDVGNRVWRVVPASP
jgi:glucose/arabinose dehydrogenase